MELALIKKALQKPGKTKGGLAVAMKVRPGAISEILAGKRRIAADEIPNIVQYLELDQVPIMGQIGAGAVIEPEIEQVPEEGLGVIQLSFPIPGELIAFEVRGDSMLPAYKPGTVIVVWKEQRRSVESFYGEDAAVRTKDGRRYLKTILPGKGKHSVDLQSFNASLIEGVKLQWIGEIYVILPAAQVRRLDKAQRAAE